MEATGRRERKKHDKLRRIREAAEALFARKGYDAATTREIADAADVGAGTLFAYVADKRELLFLVYRDRIAAALADAYGHVPQGTLVERLHFLFARLFAMYAGDPELARHFVKEQLFGGQGPYQREVEVLRGEMFARIGGWVRDAQAAGEVSSSADAKTVAWSAFALYYAALTGWLGGFATAPQALAALRTALELQHRGAAARASG